MKHATKAAALSLSLETMEGKSFPVEDAYPILTPINIYWRGLDVIAKHWDQSSQYCDNDPGTEEFEEYIFWRKNLIIWTCCTIESFVNMEGVSWMGKEFYKSNIERQNIIQKIRLIYAIKYNKSLSRRNDTLKNVEVLFEIRNQFVHPKTLSSKNSTVTDQTWKKVKEYTATSLKSIVKKVNGLITKDPK